MVEIINEKAKQEAVKFAKWLSKNADCDESEDKYQWYYNYQLHTSEEMHEQFKKEQDKTKRNIIL